MIKLKGHQLRSFNRIKRLGGVVMVHHGEGGAVHYQLPNGGSLTVPMLEQLIAAGVLVPSKDGLFADQPQTYHCAEAA